MPKSFISEDDIEQSILNLLEKEKLGYDILRLDPSPDKMDMLPDGTGRADKKDCVLPEVLWQSLKELNPSIDERLLKTAFNELCLDYTEKDIVQVNYDLYKIIRNGFRLEFTNKNGESSVKYTRDGNFTLNVNGEIVIRIY